MRGKGTVGTYRVCLAVLACRYLAVGLESHSNTPAYMYIYLFTFPLYMSSVHNMIGNVKC
ncbi:hypothetical protein F5X98DRAFT_178867 [Xylaria grammica]|nr:hypothetical protein F5X98DRAFT_178867 [Xylaria grammica]